MNPQALSMVILKALKSYLAIVITGLRQSQEKPLLRTFFSLTHRFVTPEDLDMRIRAAVIGSLSPCTSPVKKGGHDLCVGEYFGGLRAGIPGGLQASFHGPKRDVIYPITEFHKSPYRGMPVAE